MNREAHGEWWQSSNTSENAEKLEKMAFFTRGVRVKTSLLTPPSRHK